MACDVSPVAMFGLKVHILSQKIRTRKKLRTCMFGPLFTSSLYLQAKCIFCVFACICQRMAVRRGVQMARIERMAFSAERVRPGLPMDCLSLLFHQLQTQLQLPQATANPATATSKGV